MKKIASIIAAAIAGLLFGFSAAQPQVVTKTVNVPVEVEVEKVTHSPLDAVRIGELEADIASLRAELSAARLAEEKAAEATIAEWTKQAQKKSEARANGSCGPAVSGQRFRLFGRRR